MNVLGIYGKLPSHGDFVKRNLPSTFVSEWDGWLQHFISVTKEFMGDDWLNIYLTSPIWRFALSPGVIDSNAWAGIMMPSVDMVGRYFPFTVVLQLPERISPMEFIANQSSWFCQIEDTGLQALERDIDLDELVYEIESVDLYLESPYRANHQIDENMSMHLELDMEEQSSGAIYPFLLDTILYKSMQSYSVWSTTGSDRIAPCVLTSRNLPVAANMPALLDGEWAHWEWQEPYTLTKHQPELLN